LANFANFAGIHGRGKDFTAMTLQRLLQVGCALFLTVLLFASVAMSQTETATISGLITDSTGAVVLGAEVKLQSVERGTANSTTTNTVGIYVFASVHPGQYHLTVHKPGFKQVDFLGLIVNVQDHIEQNVRLQVGSVAESVTVEASAVHVNTTDATVSTVVDRQFAENLPMNGRSFQTLIYLTPGVTLANGGGGWAQGQITVNGQRAASNYWMVDGVSGNIGMSAWYTQGNGSSGSLGSFNTLGGTSSLVSVDALQEFRIQTSTYAPEFGRTPGGQISILTRSGTNRFHGTAFDYFRNSVLDATDWFAKANNLPKAQERQNDFGGTFSGPIIKDKTFFFFSYEGLRLRQPLTELTTVPDIAARQNSNPVVQPFMNAFPVPNPGAADVGPGIAPFNASFSDPSTLDAFSLRVDHALTKTLNLFGRYNYSPSWYSERGYFSSLNTIYDANIAVKTLTLGVAWSKSSAVVNDFHFNHSSSGGATAARMDTFGGGAVAPGAAQLVRPYTLQNGSFTLSFFDGPTTSYSEGANGNNVQRQYNLVDSLSIQKGSHGLRFGVDARRLAPVFRPAQYGQQSAFNTVADAEGATPNLSFSYVIATKPVTLLYHNLGVFAQDTWRITPRLTATYGLRWDIDFAPSTKNGPSLNAVTGFNLNDLSNLALLPAGTPAYATKYGNVAPRIGVAYQISQNQNRALVLRGGFGVFYDLASSEVGNGVNFYYPFEAASFLSGGVFPLPASVAAYPAFTPPGPGSASTLWAMDPNLNEPYTLQWNVALEQALGESQTLTVSYVGSSGKRLLATEAVNVPNPNIAFAQLVGNAGFSSYNALQVQFQRRLSRGLQVLTSYTWGHSIDTGSYGEYTNGSLTNLDANKGNSDFDIRHTLSGALTYDIPSPKVNAFIKAIVGGWSTENIFQVHSAMPVDIADSKFFFLTKQQNQLFFRPDVVPGQPLYLHSSKYPGGRAINPAALTDPPVDPATGNPTRQGNLGRNSLKAFGLTQWDFAVHRDFPIREFLKLQFRAEMFNVLNHPNFAPPNSTLGISDPYFGQSTQMLGQFLSAGAAGAGGFSALYQIGGPRSIQLALKLSF
jgi:hypothetical protein